MNEIKATEDDEVDLDVLIKETVKDLQQFLNNIEISLIRVSYQDEVQLDLWVQLNEEISSFVTLNKELKNFSKEIKKYINKDVLKAYNKSLKMSQTMK